MAWHANHPISGQLFTFADKNSANTYADEVEAATGYRPQLERVGNEPEPELTTVPAAVTTSQDEPGPADPAAVETVPANV